MCVSSCVSCSQTMECCCTATSVAGTELAACQKKKWTCLKNGIDSFGYSCSADKDSFCVCVCSFLSPPHSLLTLFCLCVSQSRSLCVKTPAVVQQLTERWNSWSRRGAQVVQWQMKKRKRKRKKPCVLLLAALWTGDTARWRPSSVNSPAH